jgi:hypothetical protein
MLAIAPSSIEPYGGIRCDGAIGIHRCKNVSRCAFYLFRDRCPR